MTTSPESAVEIRNLLRFGTSTVGVISVAAPTVIAALTGSLGPRAIFVVLAVVSAAPLIWLVSHRSALRMAREASG